MCPALKELDWLPIKFKLALVMFTIHTHQCPDYLADSVHVCSGNDLALVTGTNYSVTPYTYEDKIWRRSVFCGRANRVEQFAGSSSSRGVCIL